MYCPKCGKEIKDGSAFCPYCGSPVHATSQQATQTQPRPDTSAQNRVRYHVPGSNAASWVTDSFGSTLFLIISILMTCYLVMYLFSDFGMTRAFLTIPRLFICIGCWMLYSSCHNGRPESTGFTLIQGGLIALIILYCIPAIVLFFRFADEFGGFQKMLPVVLSGIAGEGLEFLILFTIVQIVAFTVQCRTEDSPKNYNESVINGRVSIIRDIGVLLILPVLEIWIMRDSLPSAVSKADSMQVIGYFISGIILLNILLYFIWRAPLKVLRLCKNGDIGDSKQNINYTSLLAIINLCGFLVLYIIQFFEIANLRDILSEILSVFGGLVEDIPVIGDGIYSLINNTASQTISSLLLIALLVCVAALLLLIRNKARDSEEQNY